MCLQEEEGQEARLSARNARPVSQGVVGGEERISEGTCRRLSDVFRRGGRVETDLESTLSGLSLLAAGVDSENYKPPVLTDFALLPHTCDHESNASDLVNLFHGLAPDNIAYVVSVRALVVAYMVLK